LVEIPRAGEIFEARYELLRVIGCGGMGSVFEARQLDCGRTVALKICAAEIAADVESRARFLQEARALSLLAHANIVTVYHLAISEAGLPYLVMELVRGESLKSLINREERLPVARAVKIAEQACEALGYAHSLNIIHRDLKPENMILLPEPEPDTLKIIDFGLARVIYGGSDREVQKLTQTGMLVGTVNYMSPEQCLGRAVDNRSDIYSLAVCFYEMLTGRTPYAADSPTGILYKQVHEAVPRLDENGLKRCHPSLQEFLERGMSKNLERRFQNMAEMRAGLDGVLDALNSPSPLISSSLISGRSLRVAAASAGLVLAALLLIVTLSAMHRRSDNAAGIKRSRPREASLSPLMRLKRIKDRLADDSLPKRKDSAAVMREMIAELDRIALSKGLSRALLLAASSYKVRLQALLGLPAAQQECTLRDCLSYCRTTGGDDTDKAAQVYVWLSGLYFIEGKFEESESAALRALRVRKQIEAGDPKLPVLDVPPILDDPDRNEKSADVCVMLANVCEARGKYAQAVKWCDLYFARTNDDVDNLWKMICRKASFLLAMGKRAQAIVLVQDHADLVYESGIENFGSRVSRTVSGFNSTDNAAVVLGKLGDWAAKKGEPALAARLYAQLCRLSEKTGVKSELKAEAERKLKVIRSEAKK
jgi:serine/threonine protein kinase